MHRMPLILTPAISSRTIVLLILLLFTVSARRITTAAEDPAALVEVLHNDDFDARRAAAEKLEALGESARTALEHAATLKDLEIKETALRLLSKLDKSGIKFMAFDRDGKPAAGAEAEFQLYPGEQWNSNDVDDRKLTIQSNGSAPIQEVAPGMANVHLTWKKWSCDDRGNYYSLNLGRGVNPLLMHLSHGGTVTALVQDGAGAALNDAQLVLYPDAHFDPELVDAQSALIEQWQQTHFNASSDATGKARLENVPDGVYQCVAKLNEFSTALGPVIRVREGETVDAAVLTLHAKAAGKIQCVLLDTEGKKSKKSKVFASADLLFEGPNAADLRRKASQLKTQMEMRGNGRAAENIETDENGKLVIGDLKPGKYKLTVRSGNDIWQARDIAVDAGKVAEMGELKPVLTGSITGKVLGSNGKALRFCSVSALATGEDFDEDTYNAQANNPWVRARGGENNSNTAQTKQDGSYELKGLPPGKYMVWIATRAGRPIQIYGLEVAAGKDTRAPEAALPATSGLAQTQELIKGLVLLPDDKPASGASVSLTWKANPMWGSRSTALSCDEKGAFQFAFTDDEFGTPSRVTIKSPGFRTYTLDLSDGKSALNTVTAHLEKQEHGGVHIKVVDEAGKALDGAVISPASSPGARNRYYNRAAPEWRAKTSPMGEAELTGLADGLRFLHVHREGYYLENDVKAMVVPNKDIELTMAMKRGLSLTGRVELPPGSTFANVSVMISTQFSQPKAVGENGEFQCDGLAPGEYSVRAFAPGMASPDHTKVLLQPGTKTPPLTLKLERMGGAAVALNTEFSGHSAMLTPSGFWDPEVTGDISVWPTFHAHSTVDKTGRAEFWGLTEGTYDVILYPQNMNQIYGNAYGNRAPKKVEASPIAGPVQIGALKTVADLGRLPATQLKVDVASGSVAGQIAFSDAIPRGMANIGSLYIKLAPSHSAKGGRAEATLGFAYPGEFTLQPGADPVIIGTPPGNLKNTEPGRFEISALPAGEYRIFVDIMLYRFAWASAAVAERSAVPKPLATFTLKEGEHLDLGKLKYTRPPDLLMEQQVGDDFQDSGPDDQVNGFQP